MTFLLFQPSDLSASNKWKLHRCPKLYLHQQKWYFSARPNLRGMHMKHIFCWYFWRNYNVGFINYLKHVQEGVDSKVIKVSLQLALLQPMPLQ